MLLFNETPVLSPCFVRCAAVAAGVGAMAAEAAAGEGALAAAAGEGATAGAAGITAGAGDGASEEAQSAAPVAAG